MTENTPSPVDIKRAAEDVTEWLSQFGTLVGLDPELVHRANHAPLRTSDLETLIVAAYRVPPVEHAETGACPVLVPHTASKSIRVRQCGAVMWIDPAGDMNSNWRCAAGHDETTPDA